MKVYHVTVEYVLTKTVAVRAKSDNAAADLVLNGEYTPDDIIDEQAGDKTLIDVRRAEVKRA